MRQPLLVVDSHYMAHRAFHMAKDLSWKGRPTGVIFGFLKSITFLKDEFQTDQIAFCFEHPHLFRRDIYPPYKRKRHTQERTEEEKQSYASLCVQISELRQRYLPKIGFKNVFCIRGMESDDIMASLALGCDPNEEVILVTGDSDLWQCLRPNVTIYSPQARKILTESWFVKKYGISPWKWAVVKALAGCNGDEVEGIAGIGETRALQYLKGELSPSSKAYLAIVSAEGKAIVRRNRRLVCLPYEGCRMPEIRQDRITKQAWIEVCSLLGMRSIAQRPPIATRKLARI